MATNPAEILAAGQALVPNAGEQMLRDQMGRLQIQGAQLQLQAQQQQLRQAQTAFQRQQSFGHDMEAFTSNPTPQGLASLFGRYPEFAKPIQDAHSALDEGRRRTDMTQIGSIAAMAAKGDFEGAAKLLETRIAADRAAGQDTSADEAILEHYRSGDPAQQKIGTAMAAIALGGAVGPEQAAAFLKANGLSNEPFTLSQGEVRYGSDGQPIASVAPKPDYLTIPEGGKAVPVGPGGPQAAGTIQGNPSAPPSATPSSPAGAHRTHGYTPRQRDGGDNPDNVVDNKIRALSQAVGVDPDTPMTPEQFATFARTLPSTENATGNNPGGVKDGPWARRQPGYAGANGQYAKFSTMDAGQQAMTNLLQNNYYNRGQRSIRDIIEGRPAGAATGSATAPTPVAQPGDPLGTIYGNAKPGYSLLSPQQAEARGLNPSKTWQVGPDGQTTAVGDAPAAIAPGNANLTGEAYLTSLPPALANRVRGIVAGRLPYPPQGRTTNNSLLAAISQYAPGFDATTWQRRKETVTAYAPGGKVGQSLISAKTLINHLYEMAEASEKLGGSRFRPLNALSNLARYETSDPVLARYNESNKFVSTELPKFLGGKAPTEGEISREIDSRSPNQGPEGRKTAIATDVNYLFGRLQPLLDGYKDAMGADFDIDRAVPGGQVSQRIAALENWVNGGKLAPPSRTMGTHPPAPSRPPPGAKLIGTNRETGKPVYLLPNGDKVSPR